MKRGIFLAILSGLMLALSFPGADLWPLAWVGFVPVFLALKDKSQKQSFLLFLITGLVFWTLTVYWLAHVTLLGTIALIIYLSLYFAFFALIIRPFTKQSKIYGLIFVPSVWVLLEYVRAHLFSGFPWALLGYSQYLNLPVIQISDLAGAYGVSFLLVFTNAAIVEMIWAKRNKFLSRFKIVAIILIALLSLTLGYGYYNLNRRPATGDHRPVRISVIQGNIPQELKWRREANDFITDKYSRLTLAAARQKPELIIWPEASVPVVPEDEPEYFTKIESLARESGVPILAGAVTLRDNLYYNSALLLSARGRLIGRYDKLHLVPFGEYIPLKKYFPFLESIAPIGDIEKGKDHTVFSLSSKFSVLICFEDLFPEISRDFIRTGAGFLVNITNDAWYKQTSAARQHFQASVFRAVENHTYLARAANTGVSGFISPTGKILSLIKDKQGRDIFIDGYSSGEIAPRRGELTFYGRYGDIFIFLLSIFTLCVIFRVILRRKKQ
ncbi:MAG: apolipoprotein N-acyltransferase [Candidatus Omnitrophica bacterium]|nr:apolipoprotein N-acyltransferase [Candidatus Omnitrophota bacterium]